MTYRDGAGAEANGGKGWHGLVISIVDVQISEGGFSCGRGRCGGVGLLVKVPRAFVEVEGGRMCVTGDRHRLGSAVGKWNGGEG